jgi:inner membrane protein
MASIGHIAVGMAAARAERAGCVPAPRSAREAGTFARSPATAMVVWSLLSLSPDADVLGFRLGIPYAHAFGHRGALHSFAFLLCVALAISVLARAFGRSALRTGLLASVVLLSHPLLDVLTDGGLGCALLWPFAAQRYFAPLRPIPVAPIGRAFFSSAGFSVALVELVMFAPLFAYALWPRKQRPPTGESI